MNKDLEIERFFRENNEINKPNEGQIEVLNSLFKRENGKVLVSAGAGTGKTHTMVYCILEAIIRLKKGDKKDKSENPFDEILVVTFTVEAARDLKTEILNVIQKIEREINDFESLFNCSAKKLKRQLENESWISTIDAFTRKIIEGEQVNVGLGGIDENPDQYELNQIQEKIVNEIREEVNPETINYLDDVLPSTNFEDGWEEAIWEILRKARELNKNTSEIFKKASDTLETEFFIGIDPTNNISEEDIRKINKYITPHRNEYISKDELKNFYLDYKFFLEKLKEVSIEAAKKYDSITKPKGKLTYEDARYHIINHLEEGNDSVKEGFDYVFVDEFQDTSYIQCELIKHFISKDTRVALIGDVRQSIYQWRDADPRIFSQMLGKEKIDRFGVGNFETKNLEVNYRSNPDILKFVNNLFGEHPNSIFNAPAKTGGISLPTNDLKSPKKRKNEEKKLDESKIHLYCSEHTTTDNFCRDWANEIAKTLLKIKKGELDLKIYEGGKSEGESSFRNAEIGDCWILMPTRTKWDVLKRNLNDRNIEYVMVREDGLFQKSPSVGVIIDILNWIKNPYDFQALSRILRSPLFALEDKSLRFIAKKDFNLFDVCRESPDFLNERDLYELNKLIELREELRWRREGRKSRLIESILDFSFFDNVIQIWREGDQEIANIRQFQEIIDEWEDDSLLSYSEFLDRINFFREEGGGYNFASLADQEDKDAVKITTVHSSKGLGFPVEFIYYPERNLYWSIRAHEKYSEGINIKNKNNEDIFATFFIDQFTPSNAVEPKPKAAISGTKNGIFDWMVSEDFSEQYRLLYVALTRAKDHLFIPKKDESTDNSASWEREYGNRFEEDYFFLEELDIEEIYETDEYKEEIEPKLEDPIKERPKLENFIPEGVTATHIYDLEICPRLYQFIELEKIHGKRDCEGKKRTEATVFGSYLHSALEINNLKNKELNLSFLETYNRKEEIKKSMKSFYNSKVYEALDIKDKTIKKEKELLYPIKIGEDKILVEGKVDLITVDNKGNISIFDYKTTPNKKESYHQKHEEYQLLTYKWLITNLYPKNNIKNLEILRYDSEKEKWNSEEVEGDVSEITKTLKQNIPIKTDKNGLKGKFGKINHCEKCRYKGICRDLS
ncbi:UvrD-helicase domain-containing protein [Methanonatronarchaeum sp. AMET-Sl]|uniref:UvrD-helicase domain-containing protein n=1 Tax=Methanonatronarchaeum sp. AMET-Sl TaxID=3037654 RepID=UPI00244DF0B4|nr:UvrD-helicase domain-containing protein [Methanonatronarchaeum sp. AMET-Sl]WGI17145.1 UvrD-helicase domain-containing protein [Methanonatronarchaeum sp. AMET-Sl]